MKQARLLLLLLIIFLTHISCKRYNRHGLPFGDVKGIHFTEVSRKFNTGLVFDKQGYQLEPVWQIKFIADDSVDVYSPKMKRCYGFHVYYDHDQIFNMIDSWLVLRALTPDSLVFQALRVNNQRQILVDDEGSNVFMTFYSDQYLKKKDPEKVRKMGLPGVKDTVYIRNCSKQVNSIPDSAFSAREPAVLKSNSPYVIVEKVKSDSVSRFQVEPVDPAQDYLFPEYTITVHKAYEDFAYSCSAFVDEKGGIRFRKSIIFSYPEFAAKNEQIIKAIIDGYVKRYVDVKPGSTLGIPHKSIILINLTGKKDQ